MENRGMKKIGKFLVDTWYGAAVAFAVSLVGWFAGVVFSCLAVGEAVAHVFGLFLSLSAVALVAAFARSLWKRAWRRAAAQFGVFVLEQVVFFGVAMGALAASEAVADRLGPWPWAEAREKNGVVPFEVEYRFARIPPMFSGGMATLDRRVAFASGKRVGLARPRGGCAPLAVYALEDGTHALADGWGYLFRVDAAAETVEMDVEGRWFRLPDGTVDVNGWSMSGVTAVLENGEEQSSKDGVPAGTSLDGRRLLGKFVPYGRFEEEAEDWLAETLAGMPSWEPWAKSWPEELPFALEWQNGKCNTKERWRVAFPSGRAVALGEMWHTPYSVQEMADGNYALLCERESEPPFPSTSYRVRPGDECVDMRVGDDWAEIPADVLWVTSWGNGGVCGRIPGDEEVCGTNSVPVGATQEGMRPVGRLAENGTFARSPDPEAAGAEAEKKAE
jgi:hypothetical protein